MLRRVLNLVFSRIVVTGVLLLLQAFWLFALFYWLADYAKWFGGVGVAMSIIMCLALIRQDSTVPEFKISWMILFAVMPVQGGILYLLWGNKRPALGLRHRLERAEDAMAPARKDDPDAAAALQRQAPRAALTARYLHDYGPMPVCGGTAAKYYPDGQSMFADMLPALQGAQHSIYVESFIIGMGEMWGQIHEILRRKAAAGLDVRVIYDDAGCLSLLPHNYAEMMRADGIRAFSFNRCVPMLNLVMNNRDHRKIMVIDGQIAFTGGVNLADEYINKIVRFGYWKDSGVCLEGEGAWGLTASFIRMCVNLGGVMHNEHDYYRPHTPVKSEGFCQPFTDGPQNNPDNPAEDVFLQMISGARRFLYITTPYFIPDESLMRALCIAGDGGVDVRLMLPGKPDHWYADCVAESYFGELIKHGVKVYRYTPGFLHGKSIMVDREAAFVGSANMDYRSFELDYECGVMVYSAPMIESLLEDMDMIVDRSHLVTAEEWAKRSVLRRVFEPLLRLFAIWM